ncbi:MAG: DHA2 family efflux MFS transporter permease subunit [bacterium]
MTTSHRIGNEPYYLGIKYKWYAAVIVMIGTFMTLLDTTIVDITLPKMMASLNADTHGIQWVVIAYMIGSAISMTAVGWIGAKIGHRETYIYGMVIFTVMSMLCGQAANLEIMTLGRFIQGLGEGLVVPVAMTILYEVFPEDEQGIAMGIFGLGASAAPALGPVLGGLLTEHLNWRWIFYVNIPVSVIGLFASILLLKKSQPDEERAGRFNLGSFLLMSVSFCSLLIFLSKGQEWGWTHSDRVVFLMVLWVVSFALYLYREWKSDYSLLHLHLFQNPVFALAVVGMFIFSMTIYGGYFLIPLYLERLLGYTTLNAGIIMLPGSIATSIGVVVGGALSDKFNAKMIALYSAIGFALATFALSHFSLNTEKSTIILLYIFWGGTFGPLFPSLTVLALNVIPIKDVNMGSAIQNISRLVAGSVGTSISVTILSRRTDLFIDRISEQIHYGNKTAFGAFQQLQHYLMTQGAQPETARKQAAAFFEMLIRRTASSYAFQSTFIWLGIIGLLCVVTVFFIKYKKIQGVKVAVH